MVRSNNTCTSTTTLTIVRMTQRKRTYRCILPLVVAIFYHSSVSTLIQQLNRGINSVTAFPIPKISLYRWQTQQQQPQKLKIFMSSLENDDITMTTPTSDHSNKSKNQNQNSKIEFLGKGTDAIVRLGAVLVAPQNEFHHFYRQAAIYIYAMGYDETMPKNDDGSSTYYIRGVILDHPTPFTVQEMIPSLSSSFATSTSNQHHPLASNLIFRGGDKGRENSVLLLHNQKNIPGCSDEIGTSGMYHGGFDYIVSTSGNNNARDHDIKLDGNNFKFFFNYCEFTEEELEELFASNEDGDAWASVQILDPSIILNEEWDRGDCWRYIRNGIVQQMKDSK